MVEMDKYEYKTKLIVDEVNKVVIGKNEIIRKVLTAILAKGHILIEDVPGVGKTTLAVAFSKAMEMKQNRIQFTPDVLPSDVVGFNIIKLNTHEEVYKPGAVMCNLLLADEINRTSSKTQSALLEAMEEGKVTVDQITRNIPTPFIVFATQNPKGSVGTQSLPESQLDRFMVRLTMGYPDLRHEVGMLKARKDSNPVDDINPVVTCEELLLMQEQVEEVFVHDLIYEYVAWLVQATRNNELIELGVSPRGTLALMNMAKANAYVYNRDYVIPEDVREVYFDVIAHRIILSSKARLQKISCDKILQDILRQVQMPKMVHKSRE